MATFDFETNTRNTIHFGNIVHNRVPVLHQRLLRHFLSRLHISRAILHHELLEPELLDRSLFSTLHLSTTCHRSVHPLGIASLFSPSFSLTLSFQLIRCIISLVKCRIAFFVPSTYTITHRTDGTIKHYVKLLSIPHSSHQMILLRVHIHLEPLLLVRQRLHAEHTRLQLPALAPDHLPLALLRSLLRRQLPTSSPPRSPTAPRSASRAPASASPSAHAPDCPPTSAAASPPRPTPV